MGRTSSLSNFPGKAVLCVAFISMFALPSCVQSAPLRALYQSLSWKKLTRSITKAPALNNDVNSPSSPYSYTVRVYRSMENDLPPTAQAPPSLPPFVSPFPSISSQVVLAKSGPTPHQDASTQLDINIEAIPEPVQIETQETPIPDRNKLFIEKLAEPSYDVQGSTTKLSSDDTYMAVPLTSTTLVPAAIETSEPTVTGNPNQDVPSWTKPIEQVRGISPDQTQTSSIDGGLDGVSSDWMTNRTNEADVNTSTSTTKTETAPSALKAIQKIGTQVDEEPLVSINRGISLNNDHDPVIRVANTDSSTSVVNTPEPEYQNSAAPISNWSMAKDPVDFRELRKTIEGSGKLRRDAEKEIEILLSAGTTTTSSPEPDDPSTSAEKNASTSKQNWSIARDPVNVSEVANTMQANGNSRNVFPKNIQPLAPSASASTHGSERPGPESGASLSPCTTLPRLWLTTGRPLEGVALLDAIEEHNSTPKRAVEEKKGDRCPRRTGKACNRRTPVEFRNARSYSSVNLSSSSTSEVCR